MSEHKKNSLLG